MRIIGQNHNYILLKESKSDSYIQEVRAIDISQQKFLNKLMKVTDENLGKHEFNVQNLGRYIGLSRPQLTEK